jgi:short-subunit dehydrogenase
MRAADARVLLTGASGGIGQEMAATLLQAGASVMLVGRSEARLSTLCDELAARLGVASERITWQATDLLDTDSLAGLANAAGAWGINVLVHNAGVPSFGPLAAVDPAEIARVLHTNLLAPMLLTQSLLPHLHRQKRSQVICVGSTLGSIGLPGFSVYGASKFGLRGFAEALRRELADTAVRVQYLGPRTTHTRFNSQAVNDYNQATGTAQDMPATVAAALLDMLKDESAQRFVGFPEKLAARINGCAPSLLDSAFNKHRQVLSKALAASLNRPPETDTTRTTP